ncbi:MAG: aminotransferase class I/II-fold pyridoxal phosphate-dependent enzyme [Planctomycetota bacterium]|nr:MAG: aminotransferase class I/II-fold pyridoxal phosphate-dependent enzyme [Planctomycetota bacterium]
MKRLSNITAGLIGQPMFKLLVKAEELERSGHRIFHFEIGDSDFRAHQHIIEATKQALDHDQTHYVDSTGIIELREAVCDYTEETLGFRPNVEQVLVMPANGIIDFVMRCVANRGEEVIYPDPGFSTYIAVTNYTGIKKVGVPLREENGFHIEAEEIRKRITDKTRLIIINSPQNPTGAVLTEDEIEDISLLADEEDLYLLSDEIYSKVVYDRVHHSPSLFDKCLERTIILNGFAKNYSMPGWRLGYAIGPKEVIKKMGILFQTIYSCTPAFIQYGGISALRGNQEVIEERIRQYQKLRDLTVKKLNEISGVSCLTPEGACYVFPNIKETGLKSTEFAEFVLDNAGVALLPGTCFGERGEGYVRLCYTRRPEIIIEGCEKMKRILTKRGARERVRPILDKVRERGREYDEVYID